MNRLAAFVYNAKYNLQFAWRFIKARLLRSHKLPIQVDLPEGYSDAKDYVGLESATFCIREHGQEAFLAYRDNKRQIHFAKTDGSPLPCNFQPVSDFYFLEKGQQVLVHWDKSRETRRIHAFWDTWPVVACTVTSGEMRRRWGHQAMVFPEAARDLVLFREGEDVGFPVVLNTVDKKKANVAVYCQQAKGLEAFRKTAFWVRYQGEALVD